MLKIKFSKLFFEVSRDVFAPFFISGSPVFIFPTDSWQNSYIHFAVEQHKVIFAHGVIKPMKYDRNNVQF